MAHSALWLSLAAFIVLLAGGPAMADAGGTSGGNPASPDLRPWNDYHVIMWMSGGGSNDPSNFPLFMQRMQDMGVDTGMIGGGGSPSNYAANDYPYYVENIVNKGLFLKYNSPIPDWGTFIKNWMNSGRPTSAFVRPYSLDDPSWQAYAKQQMQYAASVNGSHNPLMYNIRDELSMTMYADPFDFDFSPDTLAAFRTWLKTKYSNLGSLNAEWQTNYSTWDAVMPFSTDQIKNRMASDEALPTGNPNWGKLERMQFDPASASQHLTSWNFAPWADFRTYMDVSLARTLNNLRTATHEVDPNTPVGIEGTQMPSAWGGYDLHRLSTAVDWVEAYDIGNSRAILSSFMGDKPVLSTVFSTNPNTVSRQLWHNLLMGDRGAIIWWSKTSINFNDPSYPLSAGAKAIAPVLKQMHSSVADLFMRATRVYDPIALVYSQPSIQTTWMIQSAEDGNTWPKRYSSYDASHSHAVKVRDAWLKVLQDLGYAPKFIDASDLANANAIAGLKTIVLPTTRAMSADEIAGIVQFLQNAAANGGRSVFADGLPGTFDEHGKLRQTDPLAQWFPAVTSADGSTAVHGLSTGQASTQAGDIASYRQDRLDANSSGGWAQWVENQLPSDMTPAVSVPLADDVQVHRYRLGQAWLIALERDLSQSPNDDLNQSSLNVPVTLTASLSDAMPDWYLYNLLTQQCLGQVRQWQFTLQPYQPSLFALWPDKVPDGQIVSVIMNAADTVPEPTTLGLLGVGGIALLLTSRRRRWAR